VHSFGYFPYFTSLGDYLGVEKLKKSSWLKEGKALGMEMQDLCWRIGDWVVRGRRAFIGTPPTSPKPAVRVWYRSYRDRVKELTAEAEAATGLTPHALRQYTAVAFKMKRVNGLTFAHHLAVSSLSKLEFVRESQRGTVYKRRFDEELALSILNQALEENWSVAKTRSHVKALKVPSAEAVDETQVKTTTEETSPASDNDPLMDFPYY
jgi:hypothetical protein